MEHQQESNYRSLTYTNVYGGRLVCGRFSSGRYTCCDDAATGNMRVVNWRWRHSLIVPTSSAVVMRWCTLMFRQVWRLMR